jgi:hypothetical protein
MQIFGRGRFRQSRQVFQQSRRRFQLIVTNRAQAL